MLFSEAVPRGGRRCARANLGPVEICSSQRRREGKQVVDHHSRNREMLREKQLANRRAKAEAESAPAKKDFKLDQFRNVESRISTSRSGDKVAGQQSARRSAAPSAQSVRSAAPAPKVKRVPQPRRPAPVQEESIYGLAEDYGGGRVVVHAAEDDFEDDDADMYGDEGAYVDEVPQQTRYLQAKSRSKGPAVSRPGSNAPVPSKFKEKTKAPLPDFRKEPAPTLVRNERNFLKENHVAAVKAEPVPVREAVEPTPAMGRERVKELNPNFGTVPKYVQARQQAAQRKAEREEAEARAAAECPPGMVLVPEDERVETLEQLAAARKETQSELNRMPITHRSMAMERRKTALEAKLDEIEAATKIFSRSKVYIASE